MYQSCFFLMPLFCARSSQPEKILGESQCPVNVLILNYFMWIESIRRYYKKGGMKLNCVILKTQLLVSQIAVFICLNIKMIKTKLPRDDASYQSSSGYFLKI